MRQADRAVDVHAFPPETALDGYLVERNRLDESIRADILGPGLGIAGRGPNDDTFFGDIDELRISNVARSPNWIATAHRNQRAPTVGPSHFVKALGPEQ